VSRQATSVGWSLALEAHCGVAPPRHSDGYDSSARLALRSDSGAINDTCGLTRHSRRLVERGVRFNQGVSGAPDGTATSQAGTRTAISRRTTAWWHAWSTNPSQAYWPIWSRAACWSRR